MCEKKKNDAYAKNVVPSCGVAFKSRRGIVQRKKITRMHKMLFRLAVWLLKVAVGLSFAFIRLAWWLCWKTFDVCYTYSQKKTLRRCLVEATNKWQRHYVGPYLELFNVFYGVLGSCFSLLVGILFSVTVPLCRSGTSLCCKVSRLILTLLRHKCV